MILSSQSQTQEEQSLQPCPLPGPRRATQWRGRGGGVGPRGHAHLLAQPPVALCRPALRLKSNTETSLKEALWMASPLPSNRQQCHSAQKKSLQQNLSVGDRGPIFIHSSNTHVLSTYWLSVVETQWLRRPHSCPRGAHTP